MSTYNAISISKELGISVTACPFCRSAKGPHLREGDPYGYWGNGFMPTHKVLRVACKGCDAEGPRVECKHFVSWEGSDYSVEDFRNTPGLHKQEHARWEEDEEACIRKAVELWNNRKGTGQ